MNQHEEALPDAAHGADRPSTPQAPEVRPTRGIEPPTSGTGPPPTPDFGVVASRPAAVPEAVADYHSVPASAQRGAPAQSTSQPWAVAAIVIPIAAVLVLVIGLVVVGVGSLVRLAADPNETAPSSEIDDSAQSDPNNDQVAPGPGSASVETSLQAMIDEYKSARDNGSLWATIPDTDFNHTALSAFLYLLTDMRLAASFGADTSDYLARANELERKLLNQEPLGSDVTITLEDRTFTYDGDTGEGGYTAN